jgi:hypothetical protein
MSPHLSGLNVSAARLSLVATEARCKSVLAIRDWVIATVPSSLILSTLMKEVTLSSETLVLRIDTCFHIPKVGILKYEE